MNEGDRFMQTKTFHHYLHETPHSNQFLRTLQPLTFEDGYILSIQMSKVAYCIPRENIDDLTMYTHAEIAISYKDLGFVHAGDGAVSKALADRLEEFRNGTVYFTVPVDLIQEVFEEMAHIHKLNPEHL